MGTHFLGTRCDLILNTDYSSKVNPEGLITRNPSYFELAVVVAAGDGIFPELNVRLVDGVVVQEEETGDGATLMGRPLVQTPRHLLPLHIYLPNIKYMRNLQQFSLFF